MPRLALGLAQSRLDELKKQADVGLIAPRGPEILDMELAIAVTEAVLNNAPLAAAKARVVHAESLLAITNAMHGVGKATRLELEGARLAVEGARAALAELEILDMELAATVAEGVLNNAPLAAARAQVVHAERLLAITIAMNDAGKGFELELKGARLAVEEARAALAELEQAP